MLDSIKNIFRTKLKDEEETVSEAFDSIKTIFKTRLEDDKETKSEQIEMNPIQEPETKIVDIQSTLNYVSLYDEHFSDVRELITTYRDMAANFEVSEALDEIENEAVVVEDDESVTLNVDRLEMSQSIKDKISEEFQTILKLLNWNMDGHNLFRHWYIDGRMYQQKVMHKNIKLGLKKIIKLNPFNTIRMKNRETGEVYYQYNHTDKKTYIIPKDGVTFTPSGILNTTQNYFISELHKSIRPLNNYRLMWDSALIYYITRAPQKRAFYIDVGNSPSSKSEEKVKKIMQNFRQRISYDSNTGKIVQQKNSIPVNEDYYFAVRGDARGTRVDTLNGDTNLLDPEIMTMYKKQLYKSLTVPFSRVDDDPGTGLYNTGDTGETTRQEIKFAKMNQKRRKRFSVMFDDLLKTQLVSKKIIAIEEWDEIKHLIFYTWKNDSYFVMLKQQDQLKKQIETATEMTDYIGKYFSNEYVRKNVFKQTDQDIEQMDKEIQEEKSDDRYTVDEEGVE